MRKPYDEVRARAILADAYEADASQMSDAEFRLRVAQIHATLAVADAIKQLSDPDNGNGE